jgi:hypothetical protein
VFEGKFSFGTKTYRGDSSIFFKFSRHHCASPFLRYLCDIKRTRIVGFSSFSSTRVLAPAILGVQIKACLVLLE